MKEPGKAVATQPAPKVDGLEQQLVAQAKTPEERALAFELASKARQSQMIRDAAIALSEKGWGKEISPISRAAVVRYCLEIGADPTRHVFVLGGNIYLNAAFWMEIVASNPDYEKFETEFIHDDDRANAEERARRKELRVEHGVPEHAKGAAIVTLYYKSRGPFVGVNWAGARKNDPVGEQDPTKTAETRAYRRAAIKAEPAWFRKHPRLQASTEVLTQGAEVVSVEASAPTGELPPGEVPIEEIAAAAPKLVRHHASAMCKREDSHPESECGYTKKARA